MKSVPVVIGTAVGDVQTAPPPPRPSLVRRNTMMQTLLSRGLPPGLTKAMCVIRSHACTSPERVLTQRLSASFSPPQGHLN